MFEYFFNFLIAFSTNNGEKQFIPRVVIFSIPDIISQASLKEDPSLNSMFSLHVTEIHISFFVLDKISERILNSLKHGIVSYNIISKSVSSMIRMLL